MAISFLEEKEVGAMAIWLLDRVSGGFGLLKVHLSVSNYILAQYKFCFIGYAW